MINGVPNRVGITDPGALAGKYIGSFGSQLLGLSGAEDKARNDRETQLLKNNLYAHQGNKLGIETDAMRDKADAIASLAASGGIETLFANNPQLGPLAGQFLRAGESVQDLQNLGLQREAAGIRRDGGDSTLANALLEATKGNAYTPFAVQGGGVVDTGTGSFNITPVGESDVYRNRAAGAASYADAGKTRRETDFIGVPKGYRPTASGGVEAIPGLPADDAPGGLDFGDTAKLRGEFTKLSGEFIKQRDAFNRISASAQDPSAAGDLALIFNFMKLLDPGSVVRESEFATAANAAGVPDRLRNIWNRVLSGERLGLEQRADFVNRADTLIGRAREQQGALSERYRALSNRLGAVPENVVIDFSAPPKKDGGTPGDLSNVTPEVRALMEEHERRRGHDVMDRYGLEKPQ